MKKPFPKDISSLTLHLLAMGFMLCDHLWATVIPGNSWLTWLGRLAFPIFAFLIAQGYHHTGNLKKYRTRLLLTALVSEIPFDLMYSGLWFFPFHQNVLWTFLLALLCLEAMDALGKKYAPIPGAIAMGLTAGGFWLLGQMTMVDYGGWGVLTVVLFSLCRGNRWWCRPAQALGLFLINWELIRGLTVPVTLFGISFNLPQQGMAVLALPLLWCYRGRQGARGKALRIVFYGFYPVHMVLLWLLGQ